MNILLISYFDAIIGPRPFLKIPEAAYNEELEQICKLIDVYDEGFFIHVFKNFKTYNQIFTLPSVYARGNLELLLVSYICDLDKKMDSKLIQNLFYRYISEFKEISDVYKAFYVNSDRYSGDFNKLGQLKQLFSTLYEVLLSEITLIKQKRIRLFIFGYHHSGKTTIVKNLQNQLEIDSMDENLSGIFDDISILKYNVQKTEKLDDLWTLYLRNQDALIYVVDVSQNERYELEKKLLDYIISFSNKEEIPLSIIFNKKDLISKHELSSIIGSFGINLSKLKMIKIFPINSLSSDGIGKLLIWLALKLSEKHYSKNELSVNLALFTWESELIINTIFFFPKDISWNPDFFIQRFNYFLKFIQNNENGVRNSFIIPLHSSKTKLALYTDKSSGSLYCLMIFFKKQTSRAQINQLNVTVFEYLAKIQGLSENWEKFEKLKMLQKYILKSMSQLRPSLAAFNNSERRYQLLFDNNPIASIVFDPESDIIVEANKRAAEIFQKARSDLIGSSLSILPFTEGYQYFKADCIEHLDFSELAPLPVSLSLPNGQIVTSKVFIYEYRQEKQQLIYCLIIL